MNIFKKFVLFALLIPMTISACSSPPAPGTSTERNPALDTVLIGTKTVDQMKVILEFEPSKGMLMKMGKGWMNMNPTEEEIYHLEVKLEDPYSKTRISYSDVSLSLTKQDGEQNETYDLHPMWGGSGLHYAQNAGLMGDGDYIATVVAQVPSFVRGDANKDLWKSTTSTDFLFSIENGVITSEPDIVEIELSELPKGEEKDFHALVGDDVFQDMGVKVEFEDSANMYMLMNGRWMNMEPKAGDIHFEVKLTDPLKSNTRIPYTDVMLTVTNKSSGEKFQKSLHPMWGGSGLHYGANSQLAPGGYTITVDIGVPEFVRGPADEDLYMDPIQAQFEYTHKES